MDCENPGREGYINSRTESPIIFRQDFMTYLQASNPPLPQPVTGSAAPAAARVTPAPPATAGTPGLAAADQLKLGAAAADYASLGGQMIQSTLNLIGQKQAVKQIDLTQNNSPANLPMARAILLLGKDGAAGKAQVERFEAGLKKLSAGQRPNAEEVEILRQFGIGYANNPMLEEQNQIVGLVLYRNPDAGHADRGLGLDIGNESLAPEDLGQLLNMLAEVRTAQSTAPEAFAATAEALSKDQAVLAMDEKIGETLKSAESLGLQAETRRQEVVTLDQRIARNEQKRAMLQQQTQTLKQEIVQAVTPSQGEAQPAARQPVPAAAPSRQELLATNLEPELVDDLLIARTANPQIDELVKLYTASLQQDKALLDEIAGQRTLRNETYQLMQDLDAQAQDKLRQAAWLMDQSRQLQQAAAASHAAASRKLAVAGPAASCLGAPLNYMQIEIDTRVSARKSEYQTVSNRIMQITADIAKVPATPGKSRGPEVKAKVAKAAKPQPPAQGIRGSMLPARPALPLQLGVAGAGEPAVEPLFQQAERQDSLFRQARQMLTSRALDIRSGLDRAEREHQANRREALEWNAEVAQRRARFSA